MPTLEDTVDFKVLTLNDLLDADVRTGVPVAADDKYKRWAFLATGAAGMLLIALIVALATGGKDSGGGTKASKELPVPTGMGEVNLNAGTALDPTLSVGDPVTLYDDAGNVISSGGKILKITEVKSQYTKAISKTVKIAVATEDVGPVNALDTSGRKIKIKPGIQPKATTTTGAPANTAPTPIQTAPAPATTPTS